MKEAKNFTIQKENSDKIMERLHQDLISQGFKEDGLGSYIRKDVLGLNTTISPIVKVAAPPLELQRQAPYTAIGTLPNNEVYAVVFTKEDAELAFRDIPNIRLVYCMNDASNKFWAATSVVEANHWFNGEYPLEA